MALVVVVKALFLISLISNLVQSQFNSTNDTTPIYNVSNLTTTTSFYTTAAPTSAAPTTQAPTTTAPTYAPTLHGCSALYSYVHTDTLGQISSYPVSFGPLSYEVSVTQSAVFPIDPNLQPDPCDVSLFNRSHIEHTIVILDGTGAVNCDYQQWTLNMQQLGAKAVLIGVNKPFTTYDGDESLETPRIPTRLISADDRETLTNTCCDDIRLSCFDNEHPSTICVEDSEYGKQDFWRINGNYERVEQVVNGSSPMWKQDSIFNIGSRRHWQLYFDYDAYFNWVIADTTTDDSGSSSNESLIVAVCNDDTVSNAPNNCSVWQELQNSTQQYVSSTTLMISSAVCMAPDADANSTHFCVTSTHSSLAAVSGTYTQLIAGIPEWFYETENAEMAVLYWYENEVNHGWQIAVNDQVKAACVYDDDESEQVTPLFIRFQPILCAQWTDAISGAIDDSFDIDGEQCATSLIDSDTGLICVRLPIATLDEDDSSVVYEEWSGVYALESADRIFDRHRVWSLSTDSNTYYLLYYDLADAWIVSVDDDNNSTATGLIVIDDAKIVAICRDASGVSADPSECASGKWMLYDAGEEEEEEDAVEVSAVATNAECVLRVNATSPTETTLDPSAGGSTANDGFLAEFEVWEIVLMGGGLFVVVLLIVAVLCCLKRKKNADDDEHSGIAMTPYVPSGMAYDTYQANKEHQQRVSQRALKVPPTTALTSASGDENPSVDGDQVGGSQRALISLFDEDDAQQPATITQAEDNPFLNDDIIATGQTFNEDGEWNAPDVMNAFDEM